jgi:hypothetical protein
MSKPSYSLRIRAVTFPQEFATQEMQKITLNVRLYQFRYRDAPKFFDSTSKSYHLKNVTKGELSGDNVEFNINKLGGMGPDSANEVFAIGLTIRSNKKPIPRVMEKYMTSTIKVG